VEYVKKDPLPGSLTDQRTRNWARVEGAMLRSCGVGVADGDTVGVDEGTAVAVAAGVSEAATVGGGALVVPASGPVAGAAAGAQAATMMVRATGTKAVWRIGYLT
jgi:hypothetical protein